MTRRFRAAVALAVACLSGLVASEQTEVYRYLYQSAHGLAEKYAALENLVALDDRDAAPILASALEELVRTQLAYSSPTDRETYARAVRLVADALGEFKYVDAAPFLWDVVQQVPEPLTRSAALVALGRVRALEYVDRVVLLLDDLNLNQSPDKVGAEKVAYGAILCFERLKDPRGFAPVFHAADGWYSQRVRQEAERVLPNIVDDPTDIILGLLDRETARRKVLALNYSVISGAPADRKALVAARALQLGHSKTSADRETAKDLAELRKQALRTLIRYRGHTANIVDGCVESYARGFDEEERLLGLAALGSVGGDAAATALRDILFRLNDDVAAGISDEVRTRLAKEAVAACAVSRNRIVKPALIAVAANNRWSDSVITAATLANREIP